MRYLPILKRHFGRHFENFSRIFRVFFLHGYIPILLGGVPNDVGIIGSSSYGIQRCSGFSLSFQTLMPRDCSSCGLNSHLPIISHLTRGVADIGFQYRPIPIYRPKIGRYFGRYIG